VARFRKVRQTKGKTALKHAGTNLANVGSGSTPTKLIIADTQGGARIEGVQTFTQGRSTDEECNAGDLIKYLNIHIQGASRSSTDDNSIGWMEYAVVCKLDTTPDITTAQLGVLTLGNVATNLYRNDCLWTGFFPIGINQPNGAELSIKVPKPWAYMKLGYELVLFCFFRSQNSASVSTTSNRLLQSYNFKAYS